MKKGIDRQNHVPIPCIRALHRQNIRLLQFPILPEVLSALQQSHFVGRWTDISYSLWDIPAVILGIRFERTTTVCGGDVRKMEGICVDISGSTPCRGAMRLLDQAEIIMLLFRM